MNKWFCGSWRYVDVRTDDVRGPWTKENWPIGLCWAQEWKASYLWVISTSNCHVSAFQPRFLINKYTVLTTVLLAIDSHIFIFNITFLHEKNPCMWSENNFVHWEPFQLNSLLTLSDLHLAAGHKLQWKLKPMENCVMMNNRKNSKPVSALPIL